MPREGGAGPEATMTKRPRLDGRVLWAALALTLAAVVAPGARQAPPHAAAAAPAVPMLTARTLRVYTAPDADQGVAVDATHFYVVDNAVLVKYDIASGTERARWQGPASGLIQHLNSCLAAAGELLCANSNYPGVPMGSSIEVFDTAALRHVRTRGLGLMDEGSITWFDHYAGGFLAGFAHYDGNGGAGFKDHRYSSVITVDAEWRRTGGWLFPAGVATRMAPDAASGGAVGPDGWLYLLGHDRPEMYVVARPAMGPTLIHVATIALEAEGQAFSWAQDGSRTVYTIDRRRGLVRAISLPQVSTEVQEALRFR